MAYGIKVLNADNRIILNTTDGYSTLIKGASGAVTGTSFAYPSGTSSADLFLVHLPGAGFIAQNTTFSGSSDTIYSSYSSSKNWIKALPTSTSTVSGYNSGYGIKVLNAAGTDIEFSSESGSALEIVAVGTYGDLGNSFSLSYTINSTTRIMFLYLVVVIIILIYGGLLELLKWGINIIIQGLRAPA